MKRINKNAHTNMPVDRSEKINLERHSWRNWFLLAAITLITTIGLATAIPPLLSERIVNPWPWIKTDYVLLVGLSVIVIAFIGYLTQQQRYVASMLRDLEQLQDEKSELIQRADARLFALLNVSRIMGSETDLQSIYDTITKMCVETFSCRRASLMLIDKEKQELVVRSISGPSSRKYLNIRQKIGDGIAGWVAEHHEALLLGDPSDFINYPELECKDPSILSAMVVPIILRDDVIGVLNLSSKSKDIKYDQDDLKALQVFAENAGACIRHKEQADWLRSMVQNLQEKHSSIIHR